MNRWSAAAGAGITEYCVFALSSALACDLTLVSASLASDFGRLLLAEYLVPAGGVFGPGCEPGAGLIRLIVGQPDRGLLR